MATLIVTIPTSNIRHMLTNKTSIQTILARANRSEVNTLMDVVLILTSLAKVATSTLKTTTTIKAKVCPFSNHLSSRKRNTCPSPNKINLTATINPSSNKTSTRLRPNNIYSRTRTSYFSPTRVSKPLLWTILLFLALMQLRRLSLIQWQRLSRRLQNQCLTSQTRGKPMKRPKALKLEIM